MIGVDDANVIPLDRAAPEVEARRAQGEEGGKAAEGFVATTRDGHPSSAAPIGVPPIVRRPSVGSAIEARVVQAEKEGPEATVDAALERWFTDAYRARNPEMMALVRGWVVSNDKAVYPAIYSVLAKGVAEIASPEPPLRLPALVLTADEDFSNGPDMTRAIARLLELGAPTVAMIGGVFPEILPWLAPPYRDVCVAPESDAADGAILMAKNAFAERKLA